MSRGKRAALKPGTVITSIIVFTAISLAGIGYVWAKTQVWALSRELKKLELRRDELKRDNDALQRMYAGMCTPANLDARAKELNLGLTSPQPHQIVRLREPLPLVQQQQPGQYVAATNE